MVDPKKSLSPIWTHYTEIEADHAQGPYIYAADGRRYLDLTSGIGVTNTGHCHPTVVAAAQAQVSKLIHGQANIVYHRPMLELAQELQTILPSHLDSFFFSNSGAEAVESSVKLARHYTGRPNVIVFQGSFHGRTAQTMAMTTKMVTSPATTKICRAESPMGVVSTQKIPEVRNMPVKDRKLYAAQMRPRDASGLFSCIYASKGMSYNPADSPRSRSQKQAHA